MPVDSITNVDFETDKMRSCLAAVAKALGESEDKSDASDTATPVQFCISAHEEDVNSIEKSGLTQREERLLTKNIKTIEESGVLVFVLCAKTNIKDQLSHWIRNVMMIRVLIDYVSHIEVVFAAKDMHHYLRFMHLATAYINSPDGDRGSKIEALSELKSWLDKSQVLSDHDQLANFPDLKSHSADAVLSTDLKTSAMHQFKAYFEKASLSSSQLSDAGIELIQELLKALLSDQQMEKVHVRPWASHEDPNYSTALTRLCSEWRDGQTAYAQKVKGVISSSTDSFFKPKSKALLRNSEIKSLYANLLSNQCAAAKTFEVLVNIHQLRVIASIDWILGNHHMGLPHMMNGQFPGHQPIIITQSKPPWMNYIRETKNRLWVFDQDESLLARLLVKNPAYSLELRFWNSSLHCTYFKESLEIIDMSVQREFAPNIIAASCDNMAMIPRAQCESVVRIFMLCSLFYQTIEKTTSKANRSNQNIDEKFMFASQLFYKCVLNFRDMTSSSVQQLFAHEAPTLQIVSGYAKEKIDGLASYGNAQILCVKDRCTDENTSTLSNRTLS